MNICLGICRWSVSRCHLTFGDRNSRAMDNQIPGEIIIVAHRLVEQLRREAIRYVSADAVSEIRLESVVLLKVIDPVSGLPGYEGIWRSSSNQRVGSLIFNSDGSYYAEYDLSVRHPRRPDWFVEAVTAWGRNGDVRSEARLLQAM